LESEKGKSDSLCGGEKRGKELLNHTEEGEKGEAKKCQQTRVPVKHGGDSRRDGEGSQNKSTEEE